MWPPDPSLFRILVITWITARKYAYTNAYTLMSATTLNIYQDSTYKLIDSFVLTFDVASSSQLRTKIYLSKMLKMCHVNNVLIRDTVTLTRHAALLSLLKPCMCTKPLSRAVGLSIVIALYSYNP
jgi:hypothetical protein